MNVEMNVSVVDLSANQKKLQVQIPALRVQDELDRRYRDLAKNIRIKGFRPGKVPRHIIKSYYGKTIEDELSSRFIQESYQDALSEASLKPLVEADVSEMRFEDDGTFSYSALVDVAPHAAPLVHMLAGDVGAADLVIVAVTHQLGPEEQRMLRRDGVQLAPILHPGGRQHVELDGDGLRIAKLHGLDAIFFESQ